LEPRAAKYPRNPSLLLRLLLLCQGLGSSGQVLTEVSLLPHLLRLLLLRPSPVRGLPGPLGVVNPQASPPVVLGPLLEVRLTIKLLTIIAKKSADFTHEAAVNMETKEKAAPLLTRISASSGLSVD
jgi:hypothetical protein